MEMREPGLVPDPGAVGGSAPSVRSQDGHVCKTGPSGHPQDAGSPGADPGPLGAVGHCCPALSQSFLVVGQGGHRSPSRSQETPPPTSAEAGSGEGGFWPGDGVWVLSMQRPEQKFGSCRCGATWAKCVGRLGSRGQTSRGQASCGQAGSGAMVRPLVVRPARELLPLPSSLSLVLRRFAPAARASWWEALHRRGLPANPAVEDVPAA